MWFVENTSSSTTSLGVVSVRIGDPHVRPAVADPAAVEQLGLVLLSHGDSVVPSDLSCIRTEPHDLKPEQVTELRHCQFHVEVGEAGNDHVR